MFRLFVFKTENKGIRAVIASCSSMQDAAFILTCLVLGYKKTVFASAILDAENNIVKHTGEIETVKRQLTKLTVLTN